MRVLVAEDIPPSVTIDSPGFETQAAVGEPVEIVAEVEPAFERSIERVSLHVKLGDEVDTGMNLVRDEEYPAVDESSEAPYRLTFTPNRPGMYKLQVGAVDDRGIIGVSGDLHVHVQ